MANSYNDFVTKATQSGMLEKFSQEDLAIAQQSPEYGMSMLSLMQDEKNATTAEGRLLATEAASLLRKNYGLKAQAEQKQAQIEGVGSFAYSKEDDLQRLQGAVVNQPAFSYDKEEDPVYKAMRQSAIRDSQRAVEDTLARASVGTGGVPSSYAVTAAQQAANNYMGQLGDTVPTLYQNALAAYENELGMNLKRLSALEGDKATEYQLYLDKLEKLGTELKALQAQQSAGDTNYLAVLEKLEKVQEGQEPEVTDLQILRDAAIRESAEAASIQAAQEAAALKTPQQLEQIEQLKQENNVPAWKNPADPLSGVTAADVSGSIAPKTLPAAVQSGLKAAYPNGAITDAEIWEGLVADYGEAMLTAAGFRYVKPSAAPPAATGSKIGGRTPITTTTNQLR